MPAHRWPHPIRAVALDMDGLMVNTEDIYTMVGDALLQRRGRRFTAELKNKIMGLAAPEAYRTIIEQTGIDDRPEELAREAESLFIEFMDNRLAPMPGLFQLLEMIENRNLPWCVATSSARSLAERILQRIGLFDRLHFLLTGDDVQRGKPHPEIYLQAASRFDVRPAEMMVLEDSYNGTQAALAAGALTVAVPGEHSRNHDFSQVHQIVESLDDPRLADLLAHVVVQPG